MFPESGLRFSSYVSEVLGARLGQSSRLECLRTEAPGHVEKMVAAERRNARVLVYPFSGKLFSETVLQGLLVVHFNMPSCNTGRPSCNRWHFYRRQQHTAREGLALSFNPTAQAIPAESAQTHSNRTPNFP